MIEINARLDCQNDSPIHQHADGSWWFWDESGLLEFGRYSGFAEARNGMAEYIASLAMDEL